MKYSFTILIIALVCCTTAKSQLAEDAIRKGNELYKQKQYEQAATTYDEALTFAPTNTTAMFNRSNALYRQSKPDEGIKALDELVMNTSESDMRAKAYYNKGAILSAQKKLEESIEAYKSALRNDPNDTQARENLQKALLELKKRNPPPPPKEDKKKQQQKQQQQQPKMNKQEAEQRLKLLEQKEKEVQERLQQSKSKTGGQPKDW